MAPLNHLLCYGTLEVVVIIIIIIIICICLSQAIEPVGTTPDPTVTFPAIEHHRPLAGTNLYCLVKRGTCV